MDDPFFYQVLREKVTNATTRKNYEHRVNGLLKKLANDGIVTDAPESKVLLHVLTHPRKYMPILEQVYNSQVATIKNMLTLVLSLFKYADLKCKYAGPYKKWKLFHEMYAGKEQAHYNTNEPTQRQRDKYVSFNEMKARLESWKDPHVSLKSSLQYVLITMYVWIRPKRADFGRIKVYNKDPRRRDINYLVLKEGDSRFVLNRYNKTQGAKGEAIIEPVPPDLASVITASLARHPRRYLFVGKDEKPFKTPNAYSKFVSNTYKHHFGKATGVSMLRHIYISEKIDLNKLSVQEKDAIAQSMGHSRRQQEQYKLLHI